MPTFIYAPGVRVYIETERNGVLDVSEDLVEGTMVRRSDGVSTFDFSLMNQRRKYDLVFSPNDRIVVMMKRITWLRVFTGYLNTVPLRTAWPREVPLSASCSLKRLQYFYWDPYANASTQLMRTQISKGEKTKTGVTNNMIIALLSEVVGWPKGNIHLGLIPANWYSLALAVAKDVQRWTDDAEKGVQDYIDSIGAEAIVEGTVTDHLKIALGLGGGKWGNTSAGAGSGGIDPGTGGGINPDPSSGTSTGSGLGTLADAAKDSGYPAGGNAAGTLSPGTYGGVTLTAAQCAMAERIYEIGCMPFKQGRDTRWFHNLELWAALAACKGESNFSRTARNPTSSALGPFQLIAAHGTEQQRMDIDFSTKWFFNSLISHFPFTALGHTAGYIAWKTEVSSAGAAYYDKYTPMAKAIVTHINKAILARKGKSGGSSVGGSTSSGAGKTGGIVLQPKTTSSLRQNSPRTGTTISPRSGAHTGGQIKDKALTLVTAISPHIPYGAPAAGFLTQTPPPKLDCSSFVQWVVYHTLGTLAGCPRVSRDQAAWCQRISTEQALRTPGALVFVSSNGQPSGVHHVEISLGTGGPTVGAHYPGKPAGVGHSSPSYWSFGGLIPPVSYRGGQTGNTLPSGQVHSGGHNVWPVPSTHHVTTGFRVPGSHWSLGFHTGIDFGDANTGDTVVASSPGKVLVAGYGPETSYGKYVVIQSGGIRCYYGHLSMTTVSVGQQVNVGQKIGEVGNTGNSFGAHLHFECRKAPYTFSSSSLVNPLTFITQGHWSGSPTTGYPGGTGDGSGYGAGGLGGQVTPTDNIEKTYEDSPEYDASSPIDQLFAESRWYQSQIDTAAAAQSATDVGAFTLAHDSTVLQYLMSLCASSMRSFCSAPNGDFMAWFPDYYGLWGTAGILRIEKIELQDFQVNWSDDNFVTHQFVQRAISTGLDPATGLTNSQYSDFFTKAMSAGVANIDSAPIMAVLFGMPPKNASKFALYIYKKFGARPNFKTVEAVLSKQGEFFMALFYFMLQWAYQYQAVIPVTFMPEAWPGMLIQVPYFNFQAYITSVTHTFSFGEGGRFDTQVNIAAPAYMPGANGKQDDHSLLGLPLAGGYGDTAALLAQADIPQETDSVSPPHITPAGGDDSLDAGF